MQRSLSALLKMIVPYLMMFSYSLSFPFESFHLRYMTDASTLAGLYVLGSFRRLTTDKSIVLDKTETIAFYKHYFQA